MKKGKKNNLKKLFCIVLIISMVLTMLPLGREQVSAAWWELSLRWDSNIENASNCFQVEEGKYFYLGDYIDTTGTKSVGYLHTVSMLKKAAYSSSNRSVASVDAQTGRVETKKEGTAKLTCTYKGEKITCKLEVKPAGSLTDELEEDVKKYIKKMEKRLARVASVMEEELTLSNGYDMLEAERNYDSFINKKPFPEGITYSGFLESENKLVVPLAGRAWTLDYMLRQYEKKQMPQHLFSGLGYEDEISVASITATPKRMTIRAEEKITAEQILALQMRARTPEELIGRNKAKKPQGLSVLDVKTREEYQANCVFTKGSRIIQCSISKPNAPLEPARLKKGHTYRIGFTSWPWGINVTVK